MPGAQIVIDQDRPGGPSYGTPGIARDDLWIGNVVHPRSALSGNGGYAWEFLDKPTGSTATLTGDTSDSPSFTPDLYGDYRLQLITNGGGPGNVAVQILAVKYDDAGTLLKRGWRVPALGERNGEANFNGQLRGWSEAWEFILDDILSGALSGLVGWLKDGTEVGVRGIVNFIGDGVTVVDNPTDDRIDVTFTSSALTTYQDEGTDIGTRAKLNFVGATVVATDDPGNNRVNVTLTGAAALAVQEEGSSTGVGRGILNFIGGTLAAADDPGNNRVNITSTAAAVGSSTPADLAAVGDAGNATTAARSNHVHAHGHLTEDGNNYHVMCNVGVNGFMSGGQYTLLATLSAAGVSRTRQVRAASTAALTKSGAQTVDGVSCIAGDLVLDMHDATAANRGIYTVQAGAWTRSVDYNFVTLVNIMGLIGVSEGTQNGGKYFYLATTGAITLGTTALTYLPLAAEMPYVSLTKSANYTIASALEREIFCDTVAAGAGFTITLPASPVARQSHVVCDKTGAAATKNVTVNGNGNNIVGSATLILSNPYESATLFWNGTTWSVI